MQTERRVRKIPARSWRMIQTRTQTHRLSRLRYLSPCTETKALLRTTCYCNGTGPKGTDALDAAVRKGKKTVVLRLLEGAARSEIEPNAMAGGSYPTSSPLHTAGSLGP